MADSAPTFAAGVTVGGTLFMQQRQLTSVNPPKLDDSETIKLAQVLPSVFALGLNSRRQTVHSQQWRAVRLVTALFNEDRLSSDDTLVVVGGGVGGMTAAACAAVCGAKRVLLLERGPHLLPLQRGNHTRWLHPRIYDWPDESSLDPTTRLPFLNWTAGTAGDVARQILHGWRRLREHDCLPIDETTCASDVRIVSSSPTSVAVTWNDKTGHGEISAKGIIVATGFGVELLTNGSDSIPATPSYWHNDDFDQPSLMPLSRPRRVLVSGTGDGALIDLLRLCIRDFDHCEVINQFFSPQDDNIQAVVVALRKIQKRIRNGSISSSLQDSFRKLWPSGEDVGLRRIDALLASRIRDDTRVVLNGRGTAPLAWISTDGNWPKNRVPPVGRGWLGRRAPPRPLSPDCRPSEERGVGRASDRS